MWWRVRKVPESLRSGDHLGWRPNLVVPSQLQPSMAFRPVDRPEPLDGNGSMAVAVGSALTFGGSAPSASLQAKGDLQARAAIDTIAAGSPQAGYPVWVAVAHGELAFVSQRNTAVTWVGSEEGMTDVRVGDMALWLDFEDLSALTVPMSKSRRRQVLVAWQGMAGS